MSDDDLKRDEFAGEESKISEADVSSNDVMEVLPPVMMSVQNQRYHIKTPELANQIFDLGRLGLSKSNAAYAARISTHLLEKYYLDDFARGVAEMQRGLASVAVAEALNGNTPVLIHLLKTKLGWSEQHQIELSGEVRNVVSAKPMSKEEFIERYITKTDED
jgi:hypothetical protein